MYLEDGREIYESDKYPGYYIDANTGAFCDEEGNYIGGNSDDGDAPGVNREDVEIVFVTKSGHQYYPMRTKSATISMTLSEARRKRYTPSPGYISYKKTQGINEEKKVI